MTLLIFLYYREETDTNKTSSTVSKPVETSSSSTTTTTTPKPEPVTEPITYTEIIRSTETTSTSTTTPIPKVPIPLPDDNINKIDSDVFIDSDRSTSGSSGHKFESTDITYSEPKLDTDASNTYFTIPDEPITLRDTTKETTPKITFIEPQQPEITYISRPEEPERRIPEIDFTSPPPEVNYNTYKPIESNEVAPETPTIINKVTDEQPTYQEPDISNSIDVLPQTTYSPIPEKTSPSYQGVFVNVGENTETPPTQRTDDVSITPKETSESEGTKIHFVTRDCPFGFEADEYGACFGK